MNNVRKILFSIAVAISFCGMSTIGIFQNATAKTIYRCYDDGEICKFQEWDGAITHRCRQYIDACPCENIVTGDYEGHCLYSVG